MNRYKLLAAILLFLGCTKSTDKNYKEVSLEFVKTETPATQIAGENIVSQIICTGPDLCYSFSHFDIKQPDSHEFEIHAIGTFPDFATECADIVYYKDTTVSIHAISKGQYIFHFFNNNTLFKTDTVQVN